MATLLNILIAFQGSKSHLLTSKDPIKFMPVDQSGPSALPCTLPVGAADSSVTKEVNMFFPFSIFTSQ